MKPPCAKPLLDSRCVYRTFRFLSALLVLCTVGAPGVATSGTTLPPMDIPRVVLLPFSAPEEYDDLARTLTRAVQRDLQVLVEVATVKDSVPGMSGPACLIDPSCVSRVLAAGVADALLVGRIVADDDDSEPRVLVSIFAPAWRLAYAERWTAPSETSVSLGARAILAMMQRRGRSAVPPPPVVDRSGAQEAGAGQDDGLRDDELEAEPLSRQEKRRRRREERAAARGERPSVTWPSLEEVGAPEWILEGVGGGAFGAFDVAAASQTTSEENQYRWALRQNGRGWGGQVALYRRMKPRLDLGLEIGLVSEQGFLVLYYQPEDYPAYDASHTTRGVHVLVSAEVRYLPLIRGRFQGYGAVGAGLWFSPGFKGFDPEVAGPHRPFGPYYRACVNAGVGARVLVTSRVYLSVDLRGLVDPGPAFLEPVTNTDVGLSIDQLATPPVPVRTGSLVRGGVGFLF